MDHNLPTSRTSFVGRNEELGALDRLPQDCRLVTLTGVGGCGKTRLAVEAARGWLARWPDGVRMVDLGAVSSSTHVARHVAATLNVLLEPGRDPTAALVRSLGARHLLLVLDTCEHLVPDVAELADALLSGCEQMSLLTTSREPLGLEGETVWQVPPLAVDDAVALFVERARLAAPDVVLDGSLDDVRAICGSVDRLPLGVELTAAWARILSPEQIANGLESGLRLLPEGRQQAVPRHHSLQTSMAWSHELLDAAERSVFRRLSTFAGSFTLAGVEAVCAAADEPDTDVLAVLGRLLNKSLVAVVPSGPEPRFRLLDTVRHYASDQLSAAGEVDATRDRHLRFFLAAAEEAESGLDVAQDHWRDRLEGDQDNFGAALDWGLSHPGERSEQGRRLAAALARFWFIRGRAAEGSEILARAIDVDPGQRSSVQGRLYAGTAMLAMISGRTQLVGEAAQRGLEIAGEVDDAQTSARCLTMAAYPWFFIDFIRCQELAAQARVAGEAAGDPFSRDWATVLEGYTLETRNRFDEAAELASLAFENSWPRRDRFCAAFARGIRLFVQMLSGDLQGAVTTAREMVDIITPLGDYFAVGTNTANAALPIAMSGRLTEARTMMRRVVWSLDVTPGADVVGFMVTLGTIQLWDGNGEDAVRWFEQGTRLLQDDPNDWTATRCLPGLVSALRRLDRCDEAREHAQTGVRLATHHEAPYELSLLLDEQARLVRDDDPARARDLHLQSLSLRADHGLRLLYVDSLDSLALLESTAGRPDEAVELLAVSDAGREAMGYPRPPVDVTAHQALTDALRHGLGDEGYRARHHESLARPLDEVVASLLRGRGPRGRPPSGWESLTPTEVDVVRLVTRGMSNPDVAQELLMSRGSVKAHLSHVYAKLGVENRTELAAFAPSYLAEDETDADEINPA